MNGRTPYLPRQPLSELELAVLTDVNRLCARGVSLDQTIGIVAEAHDVKPIHVDRLTAFAFGLAPEIYGVVTGDQLLPGAGRLTSTSTSSTTPSHQPIPRPPSPGSEEDHS